MTLVLRTYLSHNINKGPYPKVLNAHREECSMLLYTSLTGLEIYNPSTYVDDDSIRIYIHTPEPLHVACWCIPVNHRPIKSLGTYFCNVSLSRWCIIKSRARSASYIPLSGLGGSAQRSHIIQSSVWTPTNHLTSNPHRTMSQMLASYFLQKMSQLSKV